jgi:GNAT superfamily N-acetyltransferase
MKLLGAAEMAKLVTITRATSKQLNIVLDLVGRLLLELSDEPEELPMESLRRELAASGSFAAFLAVAPKGEAVGVVTITEAIAAYAGGRYGIISELYVDPRYRGKGVGRKLLHAVRGEAELRRWRRVDVTAPPAARWHRTVAFYEDNGFAFTGPKMKCLIEP